MFRKIICGDKGSELSGTNAAIAKQPLMDKEEVVELAKYDPNTGVITKEMVDAIVNKFIENEDKNFSTFNYVNDLRAEVEQK